MYLYHSSGQEKFLAPLLTPHTHQLTNLSTKMKLHKYHNINSTTHLHDDGTQASSLSTFS